MRFGIFVFLNIFLFACNQKTKKLTIATAANMQFAMEEITRSFTTESGIECQTILGSSGKLTAQISEGAPYDLFVSADMKYPNELFRNGLTKGEPQIYANGKLVLWSLTDGIEPSIETLSSNSITHIAMANPKTAPYGSASEEVIKYYQIYESIEKKLVHGESVSQTNQFISSGAAEIGFTAKSVVLSPLMINKGRWIELDSRTYPPIHQGIVILTNRNDFLEEARLFHEFIFSPKGREILSKFGYDVTDK